MIARGRENKEYDLLDVENLEEHWYEYTGKEKTFTGDELTVKNGKGAQAVTMTLGIDYEIADYKRSDLVKLDMLLNGEICDALSLIVHKDKAYARGRCIAEKLKDVIPRQLFEIPIRLSEARS